MKVKWLNSILQVLLLGLGLIIFLVHLHRKYDLEKFQTQVQGLVAEWSMQEKPNVSINTLQALEQKYYLHLPLFPISIVPVRFLEQNNTIEYCLSESTKTGEMICIKKYLSEKYFRKVSSRYFFWKIRWEKQSLLSEIVRQGSYKNEFEINRQRIWNSLFNTLKVNIPAYIIAVFISYVIIINLPLLSLKNVKGVFYTILSVPTFVMGLLFLNFIRLDLPWTSFVLAILTITVLLTSAIVLLWIYGIEYEIKKSYVHSSLSLNLSQKSILKKDILPNLFPLTISTLGILIIHLVSGSLIVEYLFNIPGLGQLTFNSLITNDWFVLVFIMFFQYICCAVALLILPFVQQKQKVSISENSIV